MYITANHDSDEQNINLRNINESVRCGCVDIEGIDSDEITTVVKLRIRENVKPRLKLRRAMTIACEYSPRAACVLLGYGCSLVGLEKAIGCCRRES